MKLQICICLCVVFLSSVTYGQGLVESVDDFALDHFADYVSAPMELPKEYAVLTRGSGTLVDLRRGGVTEVDLVYLFSERRAKGKDYARFSAKGIRRLSPERAWNRSWDQRLVRDLKIGHRSGTPSGQYAKELVEREDVDKKESKMRPNPAHPFPLFHPFAMQYEVTNGSVNVNYADSILGQFEFQSASINKDRTIRSQWKYKSRDVTITFDPKQGGRPVEVIYMGAEDKNIKDNNKRLYSVNKIRWRKMTWNDGESCWVPVGLEKVVKSVVNAREESYAMDFVWKDCSSETVIPTLVDGDWRDLIGRAFNDSWNVDYMEWKDANEPLSRDQSL